MTDVAGDSKEPTGRSELDSPPFRRRRVLAAAGEHVDLIIAMALMAALGMVWVAVIPAFQTPDEPDHMAYAERLSQQSLFDLTLNRSTFPESLFRSITLTGGASMLHDSNYKGEFNPDTIARSEREISNMSEAERERDGALGSRSALNPPLQFIPASLLYRASSAPDYHSELFIARLFSVVMAVVALVFQYLTLRQVFASRALQRLGLAILTLMPMYAFSHISPNPDNALGLFFAAALWLAVRAVKADTFGWKVNLAFALVLTGALLSKSSGVIVIPIYAVMLIVLLAQRKLQFRWFLAHGIAVAALITAAAGWFYVGVAKYAAEEVASSAASPVKTMGFTEYVRWAATNRWEGIFNEYWGVYGWLDTSIDPRLYAAVQVVVGLAAIGLVVSVIRSVRRAGIRGIDPVVYIVLASMALLVVLIVSVDFTHVSNGTEPNGFIQGRYFMPLTTSIVLALVAGLGGLIRAELGRRLLLVTLVPALAAFHVLTLAQTVIPRYYL